MAKIFKKISDKIKAAYYNALYWWEILDYTAENYKTDVEEDVTKSYLPYTVIRKECEITDYEREHFATEEQATERALNFIGRQYQFVDVWFDSADGKVHLLDYCSYGNPRFAPGLKYPAEWSVAKG